MNSEPDNLTTPLHLMHDIINHAATIISISQFALIAKEMPSEIQTDMKRIVKTTRHLSNQLKRLAEFLEEED